MPGEDSTRPTAAPDGRPASPRGIVIRIVLYAMAIIGILDFGRRAFPPVVDDRLLVDDAHYQLTTAWQGYGRSLGLSGERGPKRPMLVESLDDVSQQWKLEPAGADRYRLCNRALDDRQCLQAEDDNRLVLAQASDSDRQRWSVVAIDDSHQIWRLSPARTGDRMSLDIKNAGARNEPILAESGSYSGQFWKFTRMP
jgi:hypothetical protein